MGEGLSNPLYPYFLPPNHSNAETHPQQNHPENSKDINLLQEYGLDFNKFSLSNGASSSEIPATLSKDLSENNFSINNTFESSFNTQGIKSQNNWTKFE